MKITIYTKSGCANCDQAKALLKFKGVKYDELNIDLIPELLKTLIAAHPEARQMPQIFIEGQRVGGLAGLQAALKQLNF